MNMKPHSFFSGKRPLASSQAALPGWQLPGYAPARPLRPAGCLALGALALACLCPASLSQATPPKASKPSQVSLAATNAPTEAEIPQSVFIIPASPREGRNPFFPRAAVTVEIPRSSTPTAVDASSIVLNGITPQPRPMVMLNGSTFEKGEEHELKVAGGQKILVKCEEIKANSAVILINGTQRRELRLKAGL